LWVVLDLLHDEVAVVNGFGQLLAAVLEVARGLGLLGMHDNAVVQSCY